MSSLGPEYRIRATDEGYELALARACGGIELYVYEEKGGHGPIETLFGAIEKEWNRRRGLATGLRRSPR